jgi:hypothetical protein
MSFIDKSREGSPSPRWSQLSYTEQRTQYEAACQNHTFTGTFTAYDNEQTRWEKQAEQQALGD